MSVACVVEKTLGGEGGASGGGRVALLHSYLPLDERSVVLCTKL